jgi:hypothetical protein
MPKLLGVHNKPQTKLGALISITYKKIIKILNMSPKPVVELVAKGND